MWKKLPHHDKVAVHRGRITLWADNELGLRTLGHAKKPEKIMMSQWKTVVPQRGE